MGVTIRNLFEVGFFFNLQASSFAMTFAASRGKHLDYQTAASLVLSFLAAAYSASLEVRKVVLAHNTIKKQVGSPWTRDLSCENDAGRLWNWFVFSMAVYV